MENSLCRRDHCYSRVNPMPLYELDGVRPSIHKSAWVADSAIIIGNVEVGAESSIWPGAVLRGDDAPIRVGSMTSIQENVVIHVDPDRPTTIGDRVTVGHQAMVHGSHVENDCIIGIGAIVFNAHISKNTIVGIGSVVLEGFEAPPGSIVLGAPAKVAKAATSAHIEHIAYSYDSYVKKGKRYIRGCKRI